jgi:hypothetical protein
MYESVETNSKRWFDLTPLLNEEFRDVEEYKGLYQVSNYGRVKRLSKMVNTSIKNSKFRCLKEKILKSLNNGKNYLSVTLVKENNVKYCKVHRLVAQAFLKKDDFKDFINHKDYNRENNRVDNLEWCTSQYNNEYSHNKHIYQKDLNNKIIKKWESIIKASKALRINSNNITTCCKGRRKTAGGYMWEYVKE